MKLFQKSNKKTKVILLGCLGFLFSGILLYPYGTFWDSARALTYILTLGHANVNNWLGWYFPLLWEGLYRITGIPNIMGTYINLIYWIGITLLYINVFNIEKRSLWWYAAFAWFPGTLIFVSNITNNSLMMVTLILGLAFYSVYSNKRKSIWLILSILIIIQCAFIRRESFVIVIPLIFIILLIYFLQRNKKWHAVSFSLVSSVVFLGCVFGVEKAITSKLANYEVMDALSITCLHDMSSSTYITKKMCIPTSIFRDEYADGKACYKDIISIENDQSIFHGDGMFDHIGPYMKIENRYRIRLNKKEIVDFYTHNFTTWLKFRAKFACQYFENNQHMFYNPTRDNSQILYDPPTPGVIQCILSFIVPGMLGSILVYYYLSLIVLLLDWKKKINYASKYERYIIFSLIIMSIFDTVLILFTSIDVQHRYLYPVCILQYLIFIYVLSKLKYRELGDNLIRLEL